MDPMLRQVLEEVLIALAEIRVVRRALVHDESLVALDAQIEAHRGVVKDWIARTFTPKTAEVVLPERCHAEQAEYCGRQNPDSIISRPGWESMCRGCGLAPADE
jgi:hypothetical protein